MMDKSNNTTRFFGILLYLAGILLAVGVAVVAFWPDLEASLFDTTSSGQETLETLSCPLVIAADETARIKATLNNPLSRPATFSVRTRIADGRISLQRQYDEQIDLDPGEEGELEWEVMATDAVFERIIMARVYVARNATVPNRDGVCGILVLPISGIGGTTALTITIIASLLLIGSGSYLWLQQARPLRHNQLEWARLGGAFALLIVINMFISLSGNWVLALLVTIFLALLTIAFLER